jgi:hypothetical protein
MELSTSKKDIEYPPFCELCVVKFANNSNAALHFDGVQHYNRIMLIQKLTSNPNAIWCQTCCCELNTQQMYDKHVMSQKHLKKEETLIEITELKKTMKKD